MADEQPRLRVRPIGLRAANAIVTSWHRHHGPSRGHKFSVSVVDEGGTVRGVGIAGRPVNRVLDDGVTLEVNRVATDGCPNACSAIYAALRRAAKALGYSRILTYTLACEPGTSLRAAGWAEDGVVDGRQWTTPSRLRERGVAVQSEDKVRWVSVL